MVISIRWSEFTTKSACLGLLFIAPFTTQRGATQDIERKEVGPSNSSFEELTRELRRNEAIEGRTISTIRARGNGPIEIVYDEGEFVETFAPDAFSISGQISREAVERIDANREARDAALAERKDAERAESEEQLEARKQAEALEKKAAEEREVQWKSDFESKSDSYKDRRRNQDNMKAVKIDAREIREDGTYVYEGRAMKPVRLWSTQRKRWEMAIPVENP